MTPTVTPNPANTTTTARPDRLSDGNPSRGERTIDRWYDVSAFQPAAQFTFGNSGRNVLRAPGLVNLDLLIGRNFAFSERKRLELRGEFFNATNSAEFPSPERATDQTRSVAPAGAGWYFQLLPVVPPPANIRCASGAKEGMQFMQKLIILLLLCGLSLTVNASGMQRNVNQAARPNIILIMADDQGYETIGANGGTSYKTPNIRLVSNLSERRLK